MRKEEREEAKDKGGFVAAALKGGRRQRQNVASRSMLTLDADRAKPGFLDAYEASGPPASCVYTTHGHTREAPRYRIIIPLARDVTPDEYNAVTRYVAKGLGMDQFDEVSYIPHQLMFWPSTPADGEYIFRKYDGEWLDPDAVLAAHPEWRDCTQLPTSSRESEARVPTGKKQADPLGKEGVVGAFCRAYTIEDAIETFLSEVYEPSATPGRYDYIPADSSAGVVIYEDKWAYSHHATDPACGKLLNAYDLVRVHKFGDDEKSNGKMNEFSLNDAKVKNEMSEEALAGAKKAFKKGVEDKFPFIVGSARSMKVDTALLAQDFRDNNRWFLTQGQSGRVTFWLYTGKIYERMSEQRIVGRLQRRVAEFDPRLVKTRDSNEAYKLLISDENYKGLGELDNDENIVVFDNGVLDIVTGALTPHSPEILSTIMLPLSWNPIAPEPKLFNRFLSELTGGDKEKQRFLCEFIGIILSNVKGYRTKKALFLRGDTDTGKSQLRMLVEKLLGPDNYASIDLATLERRFGTGLIFGKRLVGSNDLGFTDLPELGAFKQLTGGDEILMENKFSDGFTARFNGILWFSMNKLPYFGGDRGKAVVDRIIIIECGDSRPEELQDKNLAEKLFEEREGIVAKCLAAAKDVLTHEYRYSIPGASKEDSVKYGRDLSTVKTYLTECCALSPVDSPIWTKAQVLYSLYRSWCWQNGYLPVSMRTFAIELVENYELPAAQIKRHIGATGIEYRITQVVSVQPGQDSVQDDKL